MNDPQAWPVLEALSGVRAALASGRRAVLQAEPGAGKTTILPVRLLDEPWLAGRRLLVVVPRRLAARAAAGRVAELCGETPGGLVGYRVRGDARCGPGTRLVYLTEGMYLQLLRRDPVLEEAGLVVFDEFHERSLQSDLGLALTLQTAALLRPELRILLMSATLDGEAAARLVNGEFLSCPGRQHPVQIRHLGREPRLEVVAALHAALKKILAEETGDVLVFLPGTGMIHQLASRLEQSLARQGEPAGTEVLTLHGRLPLEEQRRALSPVPDGGRRIILATSIAETSLTVPGVRVVLDSGLKRLPFYDPGYGMTRLCTVTISRATAEQRSGRAGRTAPGVAYRLWNPGEERLFEAFDRPAILEEDLAGLVLELACHGICDPGILSWLDAPPEADWRAAQALLLSLGALDATGRITAAGRLMAEVPVHPRLASMLTRVRGTELFWTACLVAALLEENDPLPVEAGADITLRLAALAGRGQSLPHGAHAGQCGRIRETARELAARLNEGPGRVQPEAAGALLARAFPDRIGRCTARGRYRASGGGGFFCEERDPLAEAEYVAAAATDGRREGARLFLGAPVTLETLEAAVPECFREETSSGLDGKSGRVTGRRVRLLGTLVVGERTVPTVTPDERSAVLLEHVRKQGEGWLLRPQVQALLERIAFVGNHVPDAIDGWPDFTPGALFTRLEAWLGPHARGCASLVELEALDLVTLLKALLPDGGRQLDALAPERWTPPRGRPVLLEYAGGRARAALPLSQVFGLREHPRICRKRVPLVLVLLSPARRPVQTTDDLPGFWRGSWHEVRKELKGRYPRHDWPEDPSTGG